MGIRRIFGQTGILLSNITLGTMRFSAERIGSQDQAVSLLEYLYDQGINTYHTSHEYETHTFFCDAFKQFKKKAARDTTHIVKLASPHFEENDFTFATLEKNIDLQLQELNIEQIDIVQWLFRQKNNVDEIRIPKLLESISIIAESFDKLILAGKVRAFACFPYSISFANAVMQHNLVDGFVDYLNIIEQQWAPVLQGNSLQGAGFIAIRPLFAGKILQSNTQANNLLSEFLGQAIGKDELIQWALSYPLMHPRVASVILSISDVAQASAAIKAGTNVAIEGDNNAFIKTTHFINNYIAMLNKTL